MNAARDEAIAARLALRDQLERDFAPAPMPARLASIRRAPAFSNSPEFLRLGLMLAMERTPEEPTARSMFLKVRTNALRDGIRLDVQAAAILCIVRHYRHGKS